MTNDTKLIAFYLPQFYPIPENDAWWGEGYTEWTAVTRARPNFAGHYQPRLPADLGFCDLRVPETRRAQAALAREYGIHAFCYYYYWFSGRRLLDRPLNEVIAAREPDFPFCICWANHSWNRRWDGDEHDVLVAQSYAPDDDVRFMRDVLPLFADPRYVRVGDRPLLVVSRPADIPDLPRWLATWREECARAGIAAPYLAFVQASGIADPRPFDFDAAIEFPPHDFAWHTVDAALKVSNPKFQGMVWDYASGIEQASRVRRTDYTLFRGIMPDWDNTPRLQNNGQIFVNTGPEPYRRWLSALVQQARQTHPEERRFIFINAWNEWGEGCYLEPDERHGRAYLEATRAALKPPSYAFASSAYRVRINAGTSAHPSN